MGSILNWFFCFTFQKREKIIISFSSFSYLKGTKMSGGRGSRRWLAKKILKDVKPKCLYCSYFFVANWIFPSWRPASLSPPHLFIHILHETTTTHKNIFFFPSFSSCFIYFYFIEENYPHEILKIRKERKVLCKKKY